MLGVVEMKIRQESMIGILEYWMTESNIVTPPIRKITQNSHTGEFIIKFENEDAVKSILPPMGE